MPGIDAGPGVGLTQEGFFLELASSRAGLNVTVDLTGGSDTRLVVAMLLRALPVECRRLETGEFSATGGTVDVGRLGCDLADGIVEA